jgi:pescadillo protein
MGKATRNIGKHNWGGKKTKRSKYMTRNEAVKYLQLSLGDFRRLCILKGIHPKQPTKTQLKNKSKLITSKPLKKGVLYYYTKDIKFMNHDPLISKFREHKIFLRRLAKAEAKQDTTHVKALIQNAKPQFTYDHLVKERYPTFNSALNDLDDCLTLMFMFNHLPSGYGGIEPQRLTLVKRLCDEFCTWIVKTNSLRKCFLSFKGIYYQANVHGVNVTWIVPYGFTQQIPQEADFKVFKTFLTFYTTLMTFVNFKLYHDSGLAYPPECPNWKQTLHSFLISDVLDHNKSLINNTIETNEQDAQLHEQQQNEIRQLLSTGGYDNHELNNTANLNVNSTLDDKELEQVVTLTEEEEENKKPKTIEQLFEEKFKSLFKNLTFYISRECPVASLEFVIRSFQGTIVTDLSNTRNHKRITHYVIDRPSVPASLESTLKQPLDTLEFVQPQWIYDCINAKLLIPVEKYKPGHKLPPHLSPFEEELHKDKTVEDGTVYEPKYAQELRRMLEQEMAALRRIQRRMGGRGVEDERNVITSVKLGLSTDSNSMPHNNVNPEEVISDDEQVEDIRAVEASDSEDEEAEELRYARELEMEKTGMKYSDFTKQLEKEENEKQLQAIRSGQLTKSKQQLKQEQEIELRKSMMSRKKSKLYEQEMKKLKKSKNRVRELMQKRLEYEERSQKEEERKNNNSETQQQHISKKSDASLTEETEHVESNNRKFIRFDIDKDEEEAYDLSQFEPIDDEEEQEQNEADDLLADIELPNSEEEEEEHISSHTMKQLEKKEKKNKNNKRKNKEQTTKNKESTIQEVKEKKKRKESPTNSSSKHKNKKQRSEK